MSRKLYELKRDLNTHITESISSAIIQVTILPSLSGLNSGLGTNVDSRSSRLSRNTEGKKHQGAWGNTQNSIQINSNNHPHSRDTSLSSLVCRDDHDRKCGKTFCFFVTVQVFCLVKVYPPHLKSSLAEKSVLQTWRVYFWAFGH